MGRASRRIQTPARCPCPFDLYKDDGYLGGCSGHGGRHPRDLSSDVDERLFYLLCVRFRRNVSLSLDNAFSGNVFRRFRNCSHINSFFDEGTDSRGMANIQTGCRCTGMVFVGFLSHIPPRPPRILRAQIDRGLDCVLSATRRRVSRHPPPTPGAAARLTLLWTHLITINNA